MCAVFVGTLRHVCEAQIQTAGRKPAVVVYLFVDPQAFT
jgi:hypothetical protein